MADTLMYMDNNSNGGGVGGSPYICHRRNSSFTQTKGLLNRPGQNNCFLNSAVQVLWHLDIFRSSFRETIHHTCGEMCIFCALKELFTQFQYSGDAALPPDALRKALAQTFYSQQRFQLGYMDDAAECFENILMRIHFHITNGEAEDMCHDAKCIPHQKFAMTLVEQGICHSCGATTEPLPFTQMVHYISSSTLCAQERLQRDVRVERFGQLLRRVGDIGDVKDCPSGCGAKIQIQKTLMNHPEIISVGIAWDSERPTLDHIMDVFSTIGTVIQLQDVFHSVVDRKWGSNVKHHLVGVVTYYGKHYSTFFFHTKLRMWIYFDDATVRQIGPCWEHVVDKCRRGHFQPLLLLYANLDAVQVPSQHRAPPPLNVNQQQRLCSTPNLQKLQMNQVGYDLDSDTGYSSSDRSPIGAKHPYETGYDYYKANGHNQQQKACHFNFQLSEPDGGNYQKKYDTTYDEGRYISRRAVENVLNYQKVHHVVGLPSPPHPTTNNRQEAVPQRHPNGHFNSHYQPEMPDYNTVRKMDTNRCSKQSSRGPYDAGYDSFSLSSNDSYPVNQRQQQQQQQMGLGHIHEMHSNVPMSNGVTDICQSLCWEADNYLKQSVDHENVGDMETAINLCNGAAAKARAAMDAPYSNPHSLVLAQRKHNTCIMRARSLHRRILARQDSINSYSSSTGTETDATVLDTMSVNSGSNASRPNNNNINNVYHSRQSSRDSTYRKSLGNHSRQSSRDRDRSNGPSPAGQVSHARQSSQDSTADKKRIEVYATLPKSAAKKKSVIKNLLPSLKSDSTKAERPSVVGKDDTFWQRMEPHEDIAGGYLSSCESRPQVPKKSNPLCRTNSIPPKLYNTTTPTAANVVSAQEQLRIDEEKMAAKVEKNKQHRVRRKCLMGGLLRRKNNSMPDLREDQIQAQSTSSFKPFEEAMTPAKSEQNLSESRSGARNGRLPPPPPVRTTSQLSIRSQSHGNLVNQMTANAIATHCNNNTQASGYHERAPPPSDGINNKPMVCFAKNAGQMAMVRPPPPPPPPPILTNTINDTDEFDFPPPPPSLLRPQQPPPPPVNKEPALPHWLKELQSKQQQIGERKLMMTETPLAPTNCVTQGNYVKKMVLSPPPPAQTQHVTTSFNSVMKTNHHQKLSSSPAEQSATCEEYKSRSVRDLASKFEQSWHLSPPPPSPQTVVNNVKLIATEVPPPSKTNMVAEEQVRSQNWGARANGDPQLYRGTYLDEGTSIDVVDGPELRTQQVAHYSVMPEMASNRTPPPMANHFEPKPKTKGPKKSVKFSDQIILVAGADETENLFESPLYKKVLQKSMSAKTIDLQQMNGVHNDSRLEYHNLPRKPAAAPPPAVGAPNRMPCSLCHKKMVTTSNVYCADCDFYMSRFKPKR